MPAFSTKSADRLATCAPAIQSVFNRVVQIYDCSILEGTRTAERQLELLAAGKTEVRISKHMSLPSEAVDVVPYPVPPEWGNVRDLMRTHGSSAGEAAKVLARFYHFAGFVQATARSQGTVLRWGGDWDADRDFNDQTFDDLVHFEIGE